MSIVARRKGEGREGDEEKEGMRETEQMSTNAEVIIHVSLKSSKPVIYTNEKKQGRPAMRRKSM